MEADPLFTETIVRDFILRNGGKVANPVLVNHFKNFLNDPVRKNANRQKFKNYVNTLSMVKLDKDGGKLLVLKKKYRDDEHYFNCREAEEKAGKTVSEADEEVEAPISSESQPPLKIPSCTQSPKSNSPSPKSPTPNPPSIQSPEAKTPEPLSPSTTPVVPSTPFDPSITSHSPLTPSHPPTPLGGDEGWEDAVEEQVVEGGNKEKQDGMLNDGADGGRVGENGGKADEDGSGNRKKKEEKEEGRNEVEERKEEVEERKEEVEERKEEVEEGNENKEENKKVEEEWKRDMEGGTGREIGGLEEESFTNTTLVAPTSSAFSDVLEGLNVFNNYDSHHPFPPTNNTPSFPSPNGGGEVGEMDNLLSHETPSNNSSSTSLTSKNNRDSALMTSSLSSLNSNTSKNRTKKTADITATEYDSMAAVDHEWLLAACSSDYQLMSKLLQNHPQLASQRSVVTGYNALHWACKNGNGEAVKLLCGKYSVDPNSRTQGGYTSLHLATIHRHHDVIEILLKVYKADPSVRDFSGRLAKSYSDSTASNRTRELLNPRRVGSVLDYDQSILRNQPLYMSPHKADKENHPLTSPISTKPFKHHDYSSLMPPPSYLPPIHRSKPPSRNHSSSVLDDTWVKKGSTEALRTSRSVHSDVCDGDGGDGGGTTHSDSEAARGLGALQLASQFFSSSPSVHNEALV